mmetsp:Transcript_12196/g.38755  ORF Transcript_12196/g.38755 Transcript_12196/m.38755 type:complete len:109 (+) Transcript_12196:151-477(+)
MGRCGRDGEMRGYAFISDRTRPSCSGNAAARARISSNAATAASASPRLKYALPRSCSALMAAAAAACARVGGREASKACGKACGGREQRLCRCRQPPHHAAAFRLMIR